MEDRVGGVLVQNITGGGLGNRTLSASQNRSLSELHTPVMLSGRRAGLLVVDGGRGGASVLLPWDNTLDHVWVSPLPCTTSSSQINTV